MALFGVVCEKFLSPADVSGAQRYHKRALCQSRPFQCDIVVTVQLFTPRPDLKCYSTVCLPSEIVACLLFNVFYDMFLVSAIFFC